MARRWFYAHNGQTHGPVSARQLKYLAATGGLQPQDQIWTEGTEPDRAVVAEKALDFAALRRLAQKLKRRGGAARPAAPADELPEWVDEMDAIFRDPEQAVGPVPDWLRAPSEAPAAGTVPDWLSELSGTNAPPPEVEPEPPAPPLAGPLAFSPGGVPIAPPVAAPVGNSLLERMGIDPVTEQIVDMVKLKRWLEAQVQPKRQGELPPPLEDDADPFQTARRQLASWCDLPKNRDRLACGELSALRQDPPLLQFMDHFSRYGSDKQARLWEFIEFLIDARLRNPGR
jgi:hypothetical protein